MTHLNTDYLLQITTVIVDRTYGGGGTNGNAESFGDHLSQASTLSGDDTRNLGRGYQRTDTARNERDDQSLNTIDSNPGSHDSGNVTSSQSSSSDQEESTVEVNSTESTSEDADGDERDENSDDTTAASAAAASQGAKNNSPKSGSKHDLEADANRAATAEAAALGKSTETDAGNRKTAGKADGQAPGRASATDIVTQHVDEAKTIVANAATDSIETNEEVDEPQATGSEGKQTKSAKSGAAAKFETSARENTDVVVCGDSSAEGAATGDISPDVAKTVAVHEATDAEASATTSNAETDESSEDDSRTTSQNETRAGARGDATVQTNKVDTAQLAVATISPTDTGANNVAKGKDEERITKPITGKDEPAAAAFARMARNNIAGSHESTSGTNDLPPIDPSRFIGRVAKAFQTAQDRGGTLQLRLSPPELGALRIELNVKDGVMSASLQAENANARRLLLDHLPALRDRLAEQNIRVDRFDVDVRREGADSQTDARGSQQQQFQHQPDQPAPKRPAQPQSRAREVAAPQRIAGAPKGSDTGLNLIV